MFYANFINSDDGDGGDNGDWALINARVCIHFGFNKEEEMDHIYKIRNVIPSLISY